MSFREEENPDEQSAAFLDMLNASDDDKDDICRKT